METRFKTEIVVDYNEALGKCNKEIDNDAFGQNEPDNDLNSCEEEAETQAAPSFGALINQEIKQEPDEEDYLLAEPGADGVEIVGGALSNLASTSEENHPKDAVCRCVQALID